MSMPDEILNLPLNCGVFALWCVIRQYGLDISPAQLIELSKHDAEEGTFTIGLAVALYKLGFDLTFYTDIDLNQHLKEQDAYFEAGQLAIPILPALSYPAIQYEIENNQALVIVFYDDLEGVGNHSLVYSIEEDEICFFDSLEPMSRQVFERQRRAEGICQQAIVIHCYHTVGQLS
ncbi:peptidase C39 [Acinetobacter defluvii]|uniref:peptidase C39 n=1 Tax=Acinetobacter defluvii TaxID=1871111 RepID=UPI00148F45F0|nr:peptidase C39 [Acinetobacter defluvii]NNP72833.1 peptidase C39 [Acinetobacter defluvii]